MKSLAVKCVLACSLGGTLLPACFGQAAIPAPTLPTPPQSAVSTAVAERTGNTFLVNPGDDVQSILNRAQPGDTVVFQSGVTYTGRYYLTPKTGSGWITLRSSSPVFDPGGSLPAGTRVSPANSIDMARLVTNTTEPVFYTTPGAHSYRFLGLEVGIAPESPFVYDLMVFGWGREATPADLPYDIIIDRCYIHGLPTKDLKRAVVFNGINQAVVDSYISEVHVVGQDNAAVAGTGGPGPIKISNNYLEASGENVIFGGQDPAIVNLVPSDIEITKNYFFKPLRWRNGSADYDGKFWLVKNLLELKNARRVLIDQNLFENNWVYQGDQPGNAVLFSPRNQDRTAPWSTVSDITFSNNVIKNVPMGIGILGSDYNAPTPPLARVLIKNNQMLNITRNLPPGGPGLGINISTNHSFTGETPDSLIIDHNRIQADYQPIGLSNPYDGWPIVTFQNLSLTNNIMDYGVYGVKGGQVAQGDYTLQESYVIGGVVAKNAILNASTGYGFFGVTTFPDVTSAKWILCSSEADAATILGSDGTPVGPDLTKLPGYQAPPTDPTDVPTPTTPTPTTPVPEPTPTPAPTPTPEPTPAPTPTPTPITPPTPPPAPTPIPLSILR